MLRPFLIGSALVLLMAAPAAADTITVGVSLTPGTLKVKAPPATVTAGGPVSVPVTIADGRGHGNGWTLRLARASGASVVSVTARCSADSTCTLQKQVGRPSGVTVLRAARGTGMGVINLVVTLSAPTKSAISFTVS